MRKKINYGKHPQTVVTKKRNLSMASIILLFASIVLAASGQILLKKGMLEVGMFPGTSGTMLSYYVRAFTNPYVFFGFGFFVISAFSWLLVLSRLPLSLAYPCVAFGYVIVTLASKFVFHETISWIRWLGIAIISLGVFLISRTA